MTLIDLLAEAPADPVAEYDLVRDEVARLRRDRLVGRGQRHQGFTDDTDPTLDEVDGLIDDAADLVTIDVGTGISAAVWPLARGVIALQTALLFQPGNRDVDPVREASLEKQHAQKLAKLTVAVRNPMRLA